MPNDPINNASVSMIKQIQLSNVESYAALRTSALATGTVNLNSTSTVITATTNLPEGLILTDGVLVLITNNVVSSASGWTLNVDNTGAKPVYSSLESSTRTSTIFKLNTSLLFRYNTTRVNGGCWDVYGYDESFQKGKTYYIDPTDSNGEIQTSADIYDILQQDEYANFILDLAFYYSDGQQAILTQRPITRDSYAVFSYIDNSPAGERIVFYNWYFYSCNHYYQESQAIKTFELKDLKPIFPLSTTNKTCATQENFSTILTALLRGDHIVFMNPTTLELYTYLVINNYVQDDETPEYKLGFYGITKENELIQITLEPNPDSSSSYKMIGTYTVTDLVGPEYFVVNITNNTGSLVSDKTITEIDAANTRGAHICAKTPNGITGNLIFTGTVNDSSRTAHFTVVDDAMQYSYLIDSSSVQVNSTALATSNDISSVYMNLEESFFKPLLLLEQSGSTVTLVFGENSSATNPFVNQLCSSLNQFAYWYGRGLHCEFYLPDTQTSTVTDYLVFHLTKMDINTYQCEFACGRGDTIYTISMTPTSTTTLSGTLSSHSIPDISGLYTKPSGGIPATDLAQTVRTSLGLADTAYQKPSGGIPATDLAGTYAGAATAGGAATKAVSLPAASVDSTSTETAFTATVPGITALEDGVFCYLTNGVVTSASGWTLDVNGLGAKPVYGTLAAATRSTTIFNINYTMLFVYNTRRVSGGCWDVFYGYDSNTNTIGYQLRTNSTSLPMNEKVYRYRLLFTSANGEKWVAANASSSTNATASRTVNQTPIDPFGAIRYYGYTTAIDAGSRPGTSYMWEQYNVTLGYSFNRTGAALTLTSWKPVYIKCAPQSNGSAIIDADTPYVQSLPSTADGKIYIFLGIATAATTVEIVPEHPVYCYRNGHIQQWTGIESELDEKAPLASPAFTGVPTAPTPTAGNSSTIVANTGWVQGEITDALSGISGAMHFKGRALQTLTDGGTENAAASSGSGYTGQAGDVYLQSGTDTNEEYVWVKLGDAAGYWEKLGEDENIAFIDLTSVLKTISSLNNFQITYDIPSSSFDSSILEKQKIITKTKISINNIEQELDFEFYPQYKQNIFNAVGIPGHRFFIYAGLVIMEFGVTAVISNNQLTILGKSIPSILGINNGSIVDGTIQIDAATTENSGIVQLGTGETNAAQGNHTHGDITNAGAVTTTVTVASSDRILITDNSDSSKVKAGPAFNTASTTYFLNSAGNWTVPVGDHKVTQAAAITTNGNYPILLGNTTATTAVTATVNKASTLVYNPSTKKLLVNSTTVAVVTDIPTWTVS